MMRMFTDYQLLLIRKMKDLIDEINVIWDYILMEGHIVTLVEIRLLKKSYGEVDRLEALFYNTKPDWFSRLISRAMHRRMVKYIIRLEKLEKRMHV